MQLALTCRFKQKKQAAQGELSDLVGKVLRGGGKLICFKDALHRRRIILSSRGWRCRLVRIAHRVGHQADIDAAVIGAALFRLVGLYGLVFAQPNHINLVRRHIVFRRKILDDRIRPPLA